MEDVHNLLDMRSAERSCDLLNNSPAINAVWFDESQNRYAYTARKRQLRPAGFDEIPRLVFRGPKHDGHIISPARKACCVHQFVGYRDPDQVGRRMDLSRLRDDTAHSMRRLAHNIRR